MYVCLALVGTSSWYWTALAEILNYDIMEDYFVVTNGPFLSRIPTYLIRPTKIVTSLINIVFIQPYQGNIFLHNKQIQQYYSADGK